MPEVLQQMLNYVIAIYIRLSAEDGDLSDEKNESNSVVNQRAYIRRFIELRPEFAGAQILEFCDDGYSGTNMERPAVRRLLEQVRQRKINCIIVKDMSRFGRDYIVVGDYLEQIFPFLDVRFIAINDSYDSKDHKYGSAGLIDVSFRNVIYDLYSKDLSEKVRSTKKQLAEKGYCVAPYAFFGYQKAPGNKHTLLVDEDAAAVVRRVFDLFTSGLSTTEIARKFNTEGVLTPLQRKRLQKVNRRWNCVDQSKNYWTSAMVRKILDDERYTGKAIYGKTTRKKVGSSRVKAVTEDQWTVVDGAFPAIITQEIFNTAKSLNRNSHPGSAGESTRVFYRKIRCGHCGLAMERLQSAHPCYVCRTDRYKPDIGCPQDRIDEKELEQTVLAAIRMMAQLVRGAVQAKQRQSAKDTRYNQRLDRQIKAHQNSIQMRQQEKMAAFEDMVSGKVSAEDYQHKRGQCEKHIQRLETKIKELGDAKRRAKEEELSTYNIIPYTNVRTLTRELVDLLIQNIYIYSSTSIEIVWKCGDEYQRLLADTTKKEAAERASPDTWALENQMNYLRSFAEKHQLNVVGESQDEASGLTFDRPGLNDFLEAVRQGRADALLIKDFARLGRDSGWVMELIADLNSAGIGVFSVTDLMCRGL